MAAVAVELASWSGSAIGIAAASVTGISGAVAGGAGDSSGGVDWREGRGGLRRSAVSTLGGWVLVVLVVAVEAAAGVVVRRWVPKKDLSVVCWGAVGLLLAHSAWVQPVQALPRARHGHPRRPAVMHVLVGLHGQHAS